MSKVELDRKDGRWTLTLNDPDRRNSIDAEMRDALASAVSQIAADPEARTLVVAGAGTAFCAGADLPAMFGETGRTVSEIRADLHRIYDSFLRVLALPIPTIAAVQGPAVGAGLNLAMACDTRIVGPRAKLIASFTRIGLHPGGGCTWFLTRALGAERALQLLLDGGSVDGPDAVNIGLAGTLAEDPLDAAHERAERWAALDPALARDVKTSVRTATTADFAASLEFESWAQASSATGPAIQDAVARFRK
ncbi:enoyl-CoA hydratase [Micromonospora sp. 4G57]|uniref:Enoyl-CoA hydratase n=1 Tax=Micromonospora sicca TaxID=2202420 RepID=A0ABU5JLE3_9ACTN|nr:MULTISPECIES: enoyl-CoA hydratase [unclassified Micromonospora]MDZ5446362.1 enoyl-CoA hydratase [Micromonospora sp. 4G57]MDZ5493449.1 enoyl-CoA hydratase [Micromonospora sp. 4G53]